MLKYLNLFINMKVSLIVPCYNEEANIQKGVLDKIGNYVSRTDNFSEVLIVDDGSSDRTAEIIKNRYLPAFPKFKLIKNDHRGKAVAVISGIQQAKGDYVMFTDMDLATPIEESQKLIKEVKTYPVVIGSRSNKRAGAPILRKVMAVGGIIVRDFILNLKGIHDTQCGFKIFNKKAALHIIDHLEVYAHKGQVKGSSISAGFDMEFLYLANKMGYAIKEVPVVWKHVETKNVHFLKDSFEAMRDILKIKFFDLTGKYK